MYGNGSMIALTSAQESWSAQEFARWCQVYRENLPRGKKLLLALEHPFHQLAAMVAGLSEGRHVLLQAASASSFERQQMQVLFLPDAEIGTPLIAKATTPLQTIPSDSEALLGIATSGSSGTPKIVLHTLSSLLASASASVNFYGTNARDLIASPLPLHHIGGLMPFWRALVARASLALPAQQWRDVFTLNPTQVSLVPTQLQFLLEGGHDWSAQNCVILGAQALSPKLCQQALSAGVPLSVSYGSSESGAQLCASPVSSNPAGSVGVPLGEREIRIIDGHIAFRGPAIFHAYQNGDEIIRPFNEEGFFVSQDLGHFDSNGRLYIEGRADHIYKSGGKNVNPLQLEQLISERLDCTQALVVPIPDPDYGHLTTAFIEAATSELTTSLAKLNSELESAKRIRHARRDFPHSGAIKTSRAQAAQYMQDKLRPWGLARLNAHLKNRPELVFLHGFMGDRQTLMPLAEHFARDFNVWTLDLPFHGEHQHCDLDSWNAVIDELYFVLMRFTNLWLYGYSMGGRLALGLKERHPQLLKRLILEGAHPGLRTEQEKIERRQWQKTIAASMEDFPNFLQNWYSAPLFGLEQAQIQKLIDATAPRPHAYAQSLQIFGLAAQPDLSQQLDSSVIYVAGEHDHKYRTQTHTPVLITDCAHKASFQDPRQVYHSVMNEIARRGWHLE